jgi:hypothetical protein
VVGWIDELVSIVISGTEIQNNKASHQYLYAVLFGITSLGGFYWSERSACAARAALRGKRSGLY